MSIIRENKLTIYLPKSVREKINQIAQDNAMPTGTFVRTLILQEIEKRLGKKARRGKVLTRK